MASTPLKIADMPLLGKEAHEPPVNEVRHRETTKSKEDFRRTLNGAVPYYTGKAKQKIVEFDFVFQHADHSQAKL